MWVQERVLGWVQWQARPLVRALVLVPSWAFVQVAGEALRSEV